MVNNSYTLFIVMSKTNSFFGQIIRFFTRFKYNHVAISLNNDLTPLYSFARYNYNRPLSGGFVEESWLRYLYKNDDVPISVYTIPIDERQYQHIKNLLLHMESNSYRYDIIGAITRKRIFDKRYTCLTFTEKILKEVDLISDNESILSIHILEKVLNSYYVEDKTISGKTKDLYTWGNDNYFRKK